ncbi:hypothetical protein INR49_031703 [Caranx melampygus]|nr:hypothetical protein INR49_031703 [Caranx melampygus]
MDKTTRGRWSGLGTSGSDLGFYRLRHIDFEHKFLPSVYLLVLIIGLGANIWGLKSLLQNWKKLGIVNVFVLNLGLANILYLPTLPFLVVYYFKKSTALNPLVYLHGNEEVPAQLRQLLQRARHMFHCQKFLSSHDSVPVAETEEDGNWKKLGIVNMFVLNLGLADILYLLTLPFLVVYYFKKSEWIFGDVFCKITRFCFNLNLYGSIGFLTCISVFRYLAIVHPVRVMGRLTVTHSVVISTVVWLSVAVQSLPDMFYTKTEVFIIGVVANGWGLKSLFQNWKKLKIVNVFLLNLGLADILYLLTLPFLVVYYFKRSEWIFGDVFCKITRFCFNLNLYGSIGFLTCISVYRYLAIVHPVRVMGRLTVTHSVFISVMVWLSVAVQSLPDMFYVKTGRNMSGNCYETTSQIHVEDYLKYSLGWTVTGFCIPLLITLGCYGHIAVVLWTMNRTDKVQDQRSLKLLFTLILLFSVCYIPYHVFKNLNLWSRILKNQSICPNWSNGVYITFQITRGLVYLNSALNPLVYLHVDEEIPAQLRQLLQRALFIIGLVANVWGLKSLLQNWKKLGIINVFVLNLGLADILYLLTLPFLVVYYLKKSTWIFGDVFCKITRFCFNLNLYGSIGFLTCISVFRYLAIVHPVRVMGRLTVTHSVVISVMNILQSICQRLNIQSCHFNNLSNSPGLQTHHVVILVKDERNSKNWYTVDTKADQAHLHSFTSASGSEEV